MEVPESLSDLVPLLDEWSSPDIAFRVEKISSASPPALSRLVERVRPRLDEIEAYLKTFADRPLDETARRFVWLVECALDARHELEAREAPVDPPSDRPARPPQGLVQQGDDGH